MVGCYGRGEPAVAYGLVCGEKDVCEGRGVRAGRARRGCACGHGELGRKGVVVNGRQTELALSFLERVALLVRGWWWLALRSKVLCGGVSVCKESVILLD